MGRILRDLLAALVAAAVLYVITAAAGVNGVVIAIVVAVGALAALILVEKFWPKSSSDEPLPHRVRRRIIRSGDYAPALHGYRFTRCEIKGTVHLPGSHITRSKWLLGRFEVVSDVQSLPEGTLSFINCHFRRCTFTDCTGVGTAEQIASLRAVFGITGE